MTPSPSSNERLLSGLLRWFLLDGRRWVIAAGVSLVLLGTFALAAVAGLVPIASREPYFYLYSALVTGNLTLITVVISINQLVLSRELGSVTDLETRLRGAVRFREEVEADAGTDTAPITPADFATFLFEETASETERLCDLLDGATVDGGPGDLADTVANFATRIRDTRRDLERNGDDLVGVLTILLGIDYSTQSHNLSRLRSRHGDRLSGEATETIGRIVDKLRQIDVAQQYFKTIYVQEELAYLSKTLLYVGLPVETLGAVSVLSITVAVEPSPAAASPLRVQLLLAAITAALFVPLVVLFVYVVRVATISRRTTPTSPFSVAAARPGQSGRDS